MARVRACWVRRSERQWVEILRRFGSSGLGARGFSRREGVSLSSLQRWRRRLGPAVAGDFVELVPPTAARPTPAIQAGAPSWSLEVVLPNGACLRFRE